ncbi:Bacteriophage abortive infection AbiH [Nitrosospira multiformis]|uniref:Bacteriophage abortive infection AbiH n=1 Tax=Nitrosospira multiformis TaxID=1231 RepID=A0A1H8PXU5_9PROT|nr:bacteriophage abortive infection AbiH family protein [Nitrosospira multiformis]SEO46832.1 Bacteriophage abortive infection AbiH [Nitrosospira multiformis]
MTGRLYIIGNGFDLHHGIKSSYWAFGEFLRVTDPDTFQIIERYFDTSDDFWSNFEERLAYFDAATLIEDASEFLVGYGADDWSDSYHHDYQYEIDRAVEAISKRMRTHFAAWIRQLVMPTPADVKELRVTVDPVATFLNFNYTPSLQRLYGISESHILHIHGSGVDPEANLVLGHGWESQENLDPYRFERDPEAADTRVVEGQSIIDRYFKETFKPTLQIILANRTFFSSLAQTREIWVMGHSLADVDRPYFEEVIRHVDAGVVKWKVSVYKDLVERRGQFEKLGINPCLVEFLPLTGF